MEDEDPFFTFQKIFEDHLLDNNLASDPVNFMQRSWMTDENVCDKKMRP